MRSCQNSICFHLIHLRFLRSFASWSNEASKWATMFSCLQEAPRRLQRPAANEKNTPLHWDPNRVPIPGQPLMPILVLVALLPENFYPFYHINLAVLGISLKTGISWFYCFNSRLSNMKFWKYTKALTSCSRCSLSWHVITSSWLKLWRSSETPPFNSSIWTKSQSHMHPFPTSRQCSNHNISPTSLSSEKTHETPASNIALQHP